METKVEAPKLINDNEFTNEELGKLLKAGAISLSQLKQKKAKEVMNYIVFEENYEK